jgi:hypothetical protein
MARDQAVENAIGCVGFPKIILTLVASGYAFYCLWKIHWLAALLLIGPVAGIIGTVIDLVFLPLFALALTPWLLAEAAISVKRSGS